MGWPRIRLQILLGLSDLHGGAAMVAYCLWRKPAWSWPDALNPAKKFHWSWAASLAAGIILLIWISVQVL